MNITEREIAALRHALAKPQPPSARKRLRVLRLVFAGSSIAAVAKAEGVDKRLLEKWISRFRKSVGEESKRRAMPRCRRS